MFLRSLCPVVVFLVVQPSFGSVPVVDASTLHGKVVTGYQGWFGAPGDGNDPQVGWFHWSKTSDNIGPGLYNVDMWPDMSGFDEDELYLAPNVQLTDGSPAVLFSSRNPKTVARHFKWMKDAGIDGIFLQRFVNELSSPARLAHRNAVLENVRAAANTYGRIFAIEYDVSGATESTMASVIAADWQYLVETLDILNDPCYLYHDGKPVVIVWGLGLQGNPGTPAIATQIIDFLKNYGGGQTLIGGVDRGWRTLTIGSKTDPAWASVYRSFDIITPWTVGAYRTTAEINSYRTNFIVPDMNECNSLGIGYLPVVWPGFSWDNLMELPPGTSNFSRRNGSHLWDQVYSTKLAGATMLFLAMFDEVDESTAIFKVSEVHPVTDHWVTYEGLPGDWYLRLAGAAQRMLNGAIPLSSTIPI
ncbi:MAG: xylosidase/arabinosidase, partial [Phycisphaerales bacterium]|nr:xylosidase/arabinosidase [Phycisphaerales bacterium]